MKFLLFQIGLKYSCVHVCLGENGKKIRRKKLERKYLFGSKCRENKTVWGSILFLPNPQKFFSPKWREKWEELLYVRGIEVKRLLWPPSFHFFHLFIFLFNQTNEICIYFSSFQFSSHFSFPFYFLSTHFSFLL
jgi:hypothetical protein